MDYYYSGIGVLVWLICLGAAVGLAFIPATIAGKKGYSYGGFWVLGFFFFLIGLIVALCLDPKPGSEAYQQKYPPPYPGAAPYGPSANYGQTGAYPPPYPPPQQPQGAGEVRCAQCGNANPPGSAFCSKCGTKLS
ncbi:MAG: zinc-ribbon domain-containing protein [Christensenellales bacterium]|jgi:hypothetical protein